MIFSNLTEVRIGGVFKMTKNIALINLGGTIMSMHDPETGRLKAGAMTGDELLENANLEHLDVDIDVKEVKSIDSSEMTLEDLRDIAKAIQNVLDEGVDGIVLTHGTDTMEETAYMMDLIFDTDTPIVFTGSQLSIEDLGFDGHSNIRDAVLTASYPDSRGQGVLIVFDQVIIPAHGATKKNSIGLHAFTSYLNTILGVLYDGKVSYFVNKRRQPHFAIDLSQPFTRDVHVIRMALDFNANYLNYLVDNGCDGLVIESLGAGQIFPEAVPAVHKALEKNIPVVVVSRAYTGGVVSLYDGEGGGAALAQAGCIFDEGRLNGTQARIKLIAMLNSEYDSDIATQWHNF